MTRPRDQNAEPFEFNPWTGAASPMMEAGVKLTDKFCTQAFEVASELTDFTMRRVQEDVRLPEQLARCRTPQDLQRTWLDYWKTAMEQYQTEWGRLTELNRGIYASAMREVEKANEEMKTRIAA